MFNLTHRRHFPVIKGCEYAVTFYNDGSWGFGDKLGTCNEPFDQGNGCWSWLDESIYNIGVDADGRNLLNMSKTDNFTISELEVWALNDDNDNN